VEKLVHGGFTSLLSCYGCGSGLARADKDDLMRQGLWVISVIGLMGSAACTPTLRLQVPDKPIEINLNITMKIEQNVRIKLERELDRAADANPGIF
jgi:hypothetical protein